MSVRAGRPNEVDQAHQRRWAHPIHWGPLKKTAEKGEMCSLCLSWDFYLLLPWRWGCGDSAVSWFWSPMPGQAQRSLQKAMPVMLDQGNIFRQWWPMSIRLCCIRIEWRLLIKVWSLQGYKEDYWSFIWGAWSPQSLLRYKSWFSQNNFTYIPGEEAESRQLQCKSLKVHHPLVETGGWLTR